MEKTIRVGVRPGRISEYVVGEGTTISELLALADLNPTGFDVKVDGAKVTNFDNALPSTASLVLLAKRVKGNAGGLVRIGVMPGRINEFAIEEGQTVGQALDMADLDPTGFEVKVDGNRVELSHVITEETNLILLAKLVKGNA